MLLTRDLKFQDFMKLFKIKYYVGPPAGNDKKFYHYFGILTLECHFLNSLPFVTVDCYTKINSRPLVSSRDKRDKDK